MSEDNIIEKKVDNEHKILDSTEYNDVVAKRTREIRDGQAKVAREVNKLQYDSGAVKYKHIDRVEYRTKGKPGKAGRTLATKTYVRAVEKYENGSKRLTSGKLD